MHVKLQFAFRSLGHFGGSKLSHKQAVTTIVGLDNCTHSAAHHNGGASPGKQVKLHYSKGKVWNIGGWVYLPQNNACDGCAQSQSTALKWNSSIQS